MKALNEFLNEGKTPKFNPKNLEDPNDMKMIDSLRKHAKNYGFKEVKNPLTQTVKTVKANANRT